MRRIVPPAGPAAAPLVAVGRDPGAHETASGTPFVGPAGKLLDRALQAAGLSRFALLITNVVLEQPPGNEWSAHTPEAIAAGCTQLRDTLRAHPRTLIVAMGEQALLACAGLVPERDDAAVHRQVVQRFGAPHSDLRGYVFPLAVGPVLATVHPARVLYEWHPWWALFRYDWAKAARLLAQGGWREPPFTWRLVDTMPELRDGPIMAVDIETSPPGCIAFATSADHAVVIAGRPTRDHPHRSMIQALLATPTPKVFQNGQFDVTMLAREGYDVANWQDDLMLMWHALDPLLAGSRGDAARGKASGRSEKSLRFLASLLTDWPWWKNYAFSDDTAQFELCARDVCVTVACWHELNRRLT